jgi:glutamyl-tRNA synthetase
LLEAAGFPAQPADALMARRIGTISERAKTLIDLLEHGSWYWAAADGIEYNDAKAKRKFLKRDNLALLKSCHEGLSTLDDSAWTEEGIERVILAISEDFELKLGKVAQPLRVSITGSTRSPGIYESLWALGREKSLFRINAAIELISAAPETES